MSVTYKGKYHRNPSGFHNKVKWLLSESKWDKDNLIQIVLDISKNIDVQNKQMKSSWHNAFVFACYAINASFVFESNIRSYKHKAERLQQVNEHLKGLLYEDNTRCYKEDINVIHKKTGNVYQILFGQAIDCTNERDGLKVVVYSRDGMIFVREEKEFWQKFEKKEG